MPDIGLLQGPPPRRRRPDRVESREARVEAFVSISAPQPAAEEVAAHFAAPVGVAIEVAVPAEPAPKAEVLVAALPGATSAIPAAPSLAAPTPAPESPRVPLAPPPALTRAAPPPIRAMDLSWLALALLVIIGTGVGIREPWPADEPRFALIARDMVATGEWLFPRVGGDLYQDKPPLFFWMLAAFFSLTGSLKWSFLLPAFLAAGSTLFLIYDFGRRLVSREAGLGAALITVCTLHFIMVMRGAQIDPLLCGLTTFSLYALLRHLLFGPAWGWYALGGFVAGLGIITKGVGFLPLLVLVPYVLLRVFHWRGLPQVDGGVAGWRWFLAPLAMLAATLVWFIPMILAVHASGAPEYRAYRDEILFKQTVGRYSAAWHHVKPWYYFVLEVIPALWLPWSLLLVWLVPRFRKAFTERDARVWLLLFWVALVLCFFSWSPGKRGVYILPALPALALAATPFVEELLARPGVRRAGWALAWLLWGTIAVLAVSYTAGAKFAIKAFAEGNLPGAAALYVFLALSAAGLVYARLRAPLAAWPVVIGTLAVVFSYGIAPAMDGERSGSDFTRTMLRQVRPGERLALVAYKEQFLLYLDRPTVNFGHRRFLEGPQEAYDAAAWLDAPAEDGYRRVLLVPEDQLKPCFLGAANKAGRSSDTDWYLVRGHASDDCAAKGNASRAITYYVRGLHD
ncbi:MAG TPA: glycosyltransferase family 39 protein [Steroidobacteraceae bacterium]|nr:glycosyltransferase family 39 protein [Steroidobacteraceae bacterium]